MGEVEQIVLRAELTAAGIGDVGHAVLLVKGAVRPLAGAAIDPMGDHEIAIDGIVQDRERPAAPAGADIHVAAVMGAADFLAAIGDHGDRAAIGAGIDAVRGIEFVRDPGPGIAALGLDEGLPQAQDRFFDFRIWMRHELSPMSLSLPVRYLAVKTLKHRKSRRGIAE